MRRWVIVLVFYAVLFSAYSQNHKRVLHSKVGMSMAPDSVFNFYDVHSKLAVEEQYLGGEFYGKWFCYNARGEKVDSIDYTDAFNALNGITPIEVPEGKGFFMVEQMPWFFTNEPDYLKSNPQLFIDDANRLLKEYSLVKVFLPAITIEGKEKVANPEIGVFMSQYFLPGIKYPRRAIHEKKEGTVYAMFTVNKKGYVVDPKIVRSSNTDLSYEVTRVLLNSPKWEPGMQRDEAIDVRYIIMIQFKLQ